MILRWTSKTAALTGEIPGEWQLREKRARATARIRRL